MAYEFKKLSDVNVIEAMKDGLNVLVEDGGEIVKLAANSMIPEDVALKSDIVLAPTVASVGQTIVVKSVDESGKPTEWEAVDMASGGASSLIVQFTAESDSTATSDTDITTVCEAMEAGRTVVGYLSIGSASVLVGNPTEYQPPSMDSDGRIKFRFALMPTATSMQVIDLLLNNAGATINQYTIGGTA